jgi:4-hydroxy-tetrahydrodipicolinate synthase
MTWGVHAMSITPFTADGAIDETLFRAHLRFLRDGGSGVYVASQGSGEGDLLTTDEKLRLYRIAVDEVRSRAPVVAAGIGLAGSTAAACELAAGADAAGVDAVQILGPRPGPVGVRPDEMEAYFRAVIESVSCGVHLSSNTVLTGYEVPAELTERLVRDYSQVQVVNVSERRPVALHAYVKRLAPHVDVRVGMTGQLRRTQALGATGFLSFEANVAPSFVVDSYDTMQLDDLLRLNAALAAGGNPRSLKAALPLLGRNGGHLRAPYLPLPKSAVDDLRRSLQALRLL